MVRENYLLQVCCPMLCFPWGGAGLVQRSLGLARNLGDQFGLPGSPLDSGC